MVCQDIQVDKDKKEKSYRSVSIYNRKPDVITRKVNVSSVLRKVTEIIL